MHISRLGLVLHVLLWSCGDDGQGLGPEADRWSVKVVVQTGGETIDPDGYTLTFQESVPTPVSVNDTLSYGLAVDGTYQWGLSEVADNCSVEGPNPISLDLALGDSLTVNFNVECTYALRDQIAFDRSGLGHHKEIYVVADDGSGLTRLTNNPEMADTRPAVSPNGTQIAFVSHPDGDSEIFVMAADGGDVVRLTNHPAVDADPAWSPDGSLIVFSSTRGGTFDLFAVRPDGSELRQVTSFVAGERGPSWSPDGSTIAYWGSSESEHPAEAAGIFIVPAAGGDAVRLAGHDAHDSKPEWSPDGQWIAFNSSRTGSDEIWLVRPNGSGLVQLTDTPIDTNEANPTWSPDGRRIAFHVRGLGSTIPELRIIDVESGEVTALLSEPPSDYEPSWSRLR